MKSTTMRTAEVLPFNSIIDVEDQFAVIEMEQLRAENERKQRIADRKYKARQQRIMRERKIASNILFVFMFIATLALEAVFISTVYNVWHPDFYDFLIIAMIGVFALFCIMTLSYGYIKEKIYEDFVK